MVDRKSNQPTVIERLTSRFSPTFFDYGCCGLRVVGSDGRSVGFGPPDFESRQVVLQPQRDVCYYRRDKAFQWSTQGTPSHITVGQSNGGVVYSKSRRHTIDGSPLVDISASKSVGQTGHFNDSRISSWQIQRHCGQVITRKTSCREAPKATSLKRELPKVWNTSNRFVCLKTNTREQYVSKGYRNSLAHFHNAFSRPRQAGISVPTAEPSATSFISLEFSSRNILRCNADVDESIWAARSSSTSSQQTWDNQELETSTHRPHRPSTSSSPGYAALCLENLGWDDVTRNWNAAEEDLLSSVGESLYRKLTNQRGIF